MTPFLQEHSTRTGPVWSDIIIVIHKFVQLSKTCSCFFCCMLMINFWSSIFFLVKLRTAPAVREIKSRELKRKSTKRLWSHLFLLEKQRSKT